MQKIKKSFSVSLISVMVFTTVTENQSEKLYGKIRVIQLYLPTVSMCMSNMDESPTHKLLN